MKCVICGAEIQEGKTKCDVCGTGIEYKTVFPEICPKCGSTVSPGIRNCPNCGFDLYEKIIAAGGTAPAENSVTDVSVQSVPFDFGMDFDEMQKKVALEKQSDSKKPNNKSVRKLTVLLIVLLGVLVGLLGLICCNSGERKKEQQATQGSEVATTNNTQKETSVPVTSSESESTNITSATETTTTVDTTSEATEGTSAETTEAETTVPETTNTVEFPVTEWDKTMYCAFEALNIRKGPGTSYPILGTYLFGDKVQVTGTTSGSWVRVNYKGGEGYVNGAYLSSSEPKQTTRAKETTTAKITEKPSADNFIISDSSSRYLTKSDLSSLTATQLKRARNEIYARHGRIFEDPDLQAYFESQSWYHGTIKAADFDYSVMNDFEVENAKLMKKVEIERGY